jgi:hypothetical protein
MSSLEKSHMELMMCKNKLGAILSRIAGQTNVVTLHNYVKAFYNMRYRVLHAWKIYDKDRQHLSFYRAHPSFTPRQLCDIREMVNTNFDLPLKPVQKISKLDKRYRILEHIPPKIYDACRGIASVYLRIHKDKDFFLAYMPLKLSKFVESGPMNHDEEPEPEYFLQVQTLVYFDEDQGVEVMSALDGQLIDSSVQRYESCPICIELMTMQEERTVTVCNHTFHKKCMDVLVTRSKVCPCCRTDLSPHDEGVDAGPRTYEEFRDQVSSMLGARGWGDHQVAELFEMAEHIEMEDPVAVLLRSRGGRL